MFVCRMEDQIVEWRIVEHTSLEDEEEEEDDYNEEEVKESKIRWIVNKGLWLGKKVMITGIVISSAPVLLPPLIVISALGFASSVPFGLAFAGYTCTEKLMNKLLPRSEPPLLLGYDEEEYDEQVGAKMWMEEEEKKEMEDVKEGVEMRIQLVMNESAGPTLVEDEDVGRAEEEREINVDEGGKEEGYEEDVGEYLEGENNEGSMKEMNLETERGREAENWEFDEKIKKTEGLDLVATEARGENEGEKDVTLTPGLPERNLVEVYVENSGGLEGNEDGKDTRPEVVEKPLESKDEKVDSLVREIQGTIAEKGPEITSEEKEIIQVTKKPNVSRSSKKHHKKKKNVPISEKGEGLSNKQQEDNDVKMIEKREEASDEVEVKQDEKQLPVKRETKEGKNEANQSSVSKKAKKAAEVDEALPGSRDARNDKDVGQAANITKDPKVVTNGKHVAKDDSRPSEGKDNLAQRKVPDVNEVSGRAGTAEAKHTKVSSKFIRLS
ncbi:hypothetical protein RND71_025692 [Anisodus tanguticus]|uniref:Uncharacterized protein n=1 Tax=Anisodus tanguticus TaxID=243964 RepID=A0AAE1RTF2_9SOLA|nr:hypothetical protein RND71_025692 [Anisodus tanguticus]